MSLANVEVVQGSLERFLATGEIDWTAFDEDLEVQDHDIPERGNYRGHQGFVRWLEDWGEPWSDWTFQPVDYLHAAERVVVVINLKATGRGSGAQIERVDGIVYELRAGKIVRVDYYNSREQALEAAGIAT